MPRTRTRKTSTTRSGSSRSGGNNRSGSGNAPAQQPQATTPEASATPEVAPRQRNDLGIRNGAVGTKDNPNPKAEQLRAALAKARKSVDWTFADSRQPELLLQANGKTVCYLVMREGSELLTARTPSNQTLNIKGIYGDVSLADAVKQILAHMDARAQGGGRRAPAAAAAEATPATDLQQEAQKATRRTRSNSGRSNGRKRNSGNGRKTAS